MSLKLTKRAVKNKAYSKREVSESSFIPYQALWDSNTAITKNGEFLVAIKLDGFSFETADDEDLDMKKVVRNTLFKSIGTANYAMWFHIIRKRQQVELEGEFDEVFTNELNREWLEKHQSEETFANELYITIVRKKDDSAVGAFSDIINSLVHKADKTAAHAAMRDAHKELMEITTRFMGSLKPYAPRLLGLRDTSNGTFSELIEFFAQLVNAGDSAPMLVPNNDVASYLPTHRLYFGKSAVEVRAPDGTSKVGGAITIKEYAPLTYGGILDEYLKLPFELIITQSFTFTARGSAINRMSLQQRRMASSGDKAISQMQELSLAMDMAQSGQIGFGDHHLSIFMFMNDIDKLESALSLCYAEMVNVGIMPVREKFCLQATYWAQLPANFGYIARGSTINTLNLASFASFHNYPTGKKKNNHWGPAVTMLDTTSGTPFYFNFHVRDVGHTMIIGPTGAGKTVMMNFLMAQAQKFGGRMFFFDKDRGAEIFVRAIGGVYSVIEPGKNTEFNPLQLEDTRENRAFLEEWMEAMVRASYDQELTPEEKDRITESVQGNYKLSKEDRRLSSIAPFLGLAKPGSLAARLKMWHGNHEEEVRASLFDNPIDRLDFSKARVFGFEMGPLLDDPKSLSPVLLYLFHKINMSLDGSPTIIVLDEAWALIDNPVFAPKIKDWLKVLRKLNAMVVFATQSVEDVAASDISETLVQQTATQMYLPNPRATGVYKDTFMLSNREFDLVKRTDPSTRYFLVKQGEQSVVARIDLSGMNDVINVLSGRTSTVLLLDRIRAKLGDKPDDWLPEFYQEARKV